MTLLNESTLNEVKHVSKLVEIGLNKHVSHFFGKANVVLTKIATQDLKILSNCLGNFGVWAKHFCDFYDISHPCIVEQTKALEKTRLGMEISETIDIAAIAKSYLLSMLSGIFDDNRTLRNLAVNFANAPIRAIKDKTNRNLARENGSPVINLGTGFYVNSVQTELKFEDIKILSSEWDYQTETSFAYYARLNEIDNEEEVRCKVFYNSLNEMGMSKQANTYKKRIETIKFQNKNTHCGFKPIALTTAAYILGKVHCYCYDKLSKISVHPLDTKVNILFDFILPAPSLLKLILKDSAVLNKDSTVGEIIRSVKDNKESDLNIFYAECGYLFGYQPRIYSLQCFSSLIPDRINKLLESLDAFEDYGGYPLFDKYYILVPGISFNEAFFLQPSLKYRFKTNNCRIIDVNNKDEAYYMIDNYLLINKLICPIILGQKDGCYFFLDYLY
jgi:hypothetical protein